MSRSVSVFCSQYGGTVGATFCLRDQLFPAKPFFAQRKVAADISISRSSVVHEADDGGLGGPMMEEDGCDYNDFNFWRAPLPPFAAPVPSEPAASSVSLESLHPMDASSPAEPMRSDELLDVEEGRRRAVWRRRRPPRRPPGRAARARGCSGSWASCRSTSGRRASRGWRECCRRTSCGCANRVRRSRSRAAASPRPTARPSRRPA